MNQPLRWLRTISFSLAFMSLSIVVLLSVLVVGFLLISYLVYFLPLASMKLRVLLIGLLWGSLIGSFRGSWVTDRVPTTILWWCLVVHGMLGAVGLLIAFTLFGIHDGALPILDGVERGLALGLIWATVSTILEWWHVRRQCRQVWIWLSSGYLSWFLLWLMVGYGSSLSWEN